MSSADDPVVDLYLRGELSAIHRGLKSGEWKGTVQHDLARALLERDGNEAFERFEKLTEREDASPAIKSVAWFHLYGYYKLVGDLELQRKALRSLEASPEIARSLFHGPVPDPDSLLPATAGLIPGGSRDSDRSFAAPHPVPSSSEGPYSVQIGAFSSMDRAERFAEGNRWTGDPVRIVPATVSGTTLYTVRVGHFPDESAARRYGLARFGEEMKDFKVVKD